MSISRLLIIALSALLITACGGDGGRNPGKFGGNSDDDDDIDNVMSGLDSRPSNTTCLATNYNQPSEIELTRIVPSLGFSRPILFLPHPADDDIFYVVQQRGVIWRVNVQAGTRTEFVDLEDYYNLDTCNECGLLGMTFDPDFNSNRTIYLSFNQTVSGQMRSFVARFTATDTNATALETASSTLVRTNILNVAQPYENHNGGHIAFGPDGYLYIGLGDGGSANDPPQNGQDTGNLLGKMLRVDGDGNAAPDNPFVGQAGEDRIFAYGLRNPWRWSFDRETGDLWLGDVGQNDYEEVDIIVNGGNYGWRCREGLHDNPGVGSCTINGGSHINPVAEYDHSEGVSITGGYVYRGASMEDYAGVYFFGDYGSGRIWGLLPQDDGSYNRILLLDTSLNIASFGEDHDGALYVIDHDGGIYRIGLDSGSTNPPVPVPELLSDTGCVNSSDPTQPAAGLIPYDINEPFWSDGADKQRYMALPNNAEIDVDADGDFIFPTGTVLMKNFRLDNQLIETRLFIRGWTGWQGYSYQWNSGQTEATLLDDDADVVIGSQTWHYPSSSECDQCHTGAAGFSLGLETAQLNRDFTYPSTGRTDNQLDTFEDIGMFESSLESSVRNLRLRSSADTDQTLNNRARAYLHSNCSQCHRPDSGTPGNMDFRFQTDFADMNICNVVPLDTLGIPGARRLYPGAHSLSVLWVRMGAGPNHMPPISSNVVDTAGMGLMENWINSLSSCTP